MSSQCGYSLIYTFTFNILLVTCSLVSNSATPWTVAHQSPLSMEFSRQEYWNGWINQWQKLWVKYQSKSWDTTCKPWCLSCPAMMRMVKMWRFPMYDTAFANPFMFLFHVFSQLNFLAKAEPYILLRTSCCCFLCLALEFLIDINPKNKKKNNGVGCHFLLQRSSWPRIKHTICCVFCIGRRVLYH